ncbi:MAG: ATP synthase F1 subunit gamma [Deltaproteobacteria bacterium]|jgi:F-type H+-transporting ATPase subunit gamma|nr:ATP synthase F1 subunit gamma [Deltaproteobacteria bacterium]
MASLKDIKRHIVAVRQTQKLTKAMNMVAAAKLRSTQSRTERFQHYADEFSRLAKEIGVRCRNVTSDILKPDPDSQRVLVVLISTERGLCGSFNSNLFDASDKFILELKKLGLYPDIYVLGRKGFEYYKRRQAYVQVVGKMIGVMADFNYKFATTLCEDFIHNFTEKDGYKEIYLVSTKFESLTHHPVVVDPFLPFSSESVLETSKASPEPATQTPPENSLATLDYLIEPDAEELLNILIPRSLSIKIFRALLDSVTAENAARMQAMENATNSCKDIIDNLTMAYNKARQASVTNELLDIVNGSEALKG